MTKYFTNESEFNRAWSKALELRGAKVIALVGSAMQESGLPDRLVVHRNFFGFIEGKVDDNPLSTLQHTQLKKLAARCAPALVLRWLEASREAQLELPNGQVVCHVQPGPKNSFPALMNSIEQFANLSATASTAEAIALQSAMKQLQEAHTRIRDLESAQQRRFV